MSCELYQQQLSLLLDNELNIQDFPDLNKHLEQCSLCTKMYNDFQDIDEEYQKCSYPFPAPDITGQLVKCVAVSHSKRNMLPLIAAIFLAFVFGVLLTIAYGKVNSDTIYVVQPSDLEPNIDIIDQLVLYQQQKKWQKAKPLLKTLIRENEDSQILAIASFYLAQVYVQEKKFSHAIKVLSDFSKFTELNMIDQVDYNSFVSEHSDSTIFIKDALTLAKKLQSLVKYAEDKKLIKEQIKLLELLSKGKIF
ncbi:hypothetical protein [Candidatus Uabimicrobium sp. HlEnr_7]|uniref:hypothetical protein n=1 Tax=Candidatus Uabimicrobium helgolandensis TaxID=3095367 RepID=UPI00355637FD